MEPVSEATMQQILATARPYTVVILWKGPNYAASDARAIGWEHGKRNMQLRLAGQLNIVVPFTDEGDIRGIDVFHQPIDDVKALLTDDPALRAGVLVAEYRCGLSFAGDHLKDAQNSEDGSASCTSNDTKSDQCSIHSSSAPRDADRMS